MNVSLLKFKIMRQLILLILNSTTLIFALLMNYLSGTGKFGASVADISAMYQTPFTPAGYAFSIWGLIYIMLIAFVIHQWYAAYRLKDNKELTQAGLWFSLANLANGMWIYAWTNNMITLSMVIMIVLLISLIMLSLRLHLETWDAPFRIILFVWWPLVIYLGWIVTATVANATVWLVSIGCQGGPMTPSEWTIILIIIATLVYAFLIYYRNMREAAGVGIWALVAIAIRHWNSQVDIAWTALGTAVLLFIYIVWHGYMNRDTSPMQKLKEKL